MIRLANVIVVHGDRSEADALAERLERNGYHTSVSTAAHQGLAQAEADRPDLVLIGEPGGDPITLGQALKADPSTADIPVVILARDDQATSTVRALDAGLDGVIGWDIDDAELFARLRPLVRLATMHSELRQRAIVARQFGVHARDRVKPSQGERPSILLIGSDNDGILALLGAEAEVVAPGNLYEAEEMLTRRPFDAAVMCVGPDAEGMLDFCSQVRNNPRLFNLPMVLVVDSGVSAVDAYRRGASRVFFRPTDTAELRAAVLTLVRRQQLRWSIRGAMFDSLTPATRDPATGSYSRAFFDKYLQNRLDIALNHDRHLTVVFFYVPNLDGVRRQFGDDAGEHLTLQLSQWIGGLLRAEDVTAHYDRNKFVVALPDTPLAEAEVVMHRIAGVLAYTDFAVREVYQPVKVWVQVGCTDARLGDDMAKLVARAHQNLD
jgi:two-component system cell cycle response regulator